MEICTQTRGEDDNQKQTHAHLKIILRTSRGQPFALTIIQLYETIYSVWSFGRSQEHGLDGTPVQHTHTHPLLVASLPTIMVLGCNLVETQTLT